MVAEILPADIQAALLANTNSANTWGKLSPSHQREYLKWINEAKKPPTRTKRIVKMVTMLSKIR